MEIAFAPKDLRVANDVSERLGYLDLRRPGGEPNRAAMAGLGNAGEPVGQVWEQSRALWALALGR